MSIEDPITPENNESLTDEQFFSRMSRSLRENDYESVDKLMDSPAPEEPITEEITSEEPESAEVPVEAVAATEEVQPTVGATPAEVVGEVKPSDWTATLPKEAQDELQRLRQIEQRARSEAGRVPYLQKKLADLEKKLHSPQASPTPVQPSGQPEPSLSKELEDALAQIGEVDPVTAKALSLLRKEAQGSVKKTENILIQKEEEAHMAKEYNKLCDLIPQAPDVFKLPEWSMWKEEQAPGIKNLASSSYADDVAFAMEKFAKDMAARNPDLVKPRATSTPVAAPVVAAPVVATPDPKQAAITEQRTRRLQATTPTSAAPAATGDTEPKDPEALFRHFSAMVRKQHHLDKPR